MFETSVIRAAARPAEKRYALFSLSVAAHAAVIVAVVGASLRSIEFPSHAPSEYAIPVIPLPITIPPPLGTPHPKAATAPAQAAQKPATAHLTAPQFLPEHAVPAAPAAASSTIGDTTTTDPNASSDDVGVPWGVKRSIGPIPQVAEPPADAGPMRVGEGVSAPVVLQRVQPLYPRTAIAMHLSGSVTVEAIIDRTGHVREAHVVRSTSSMFEQSALDAVQQWTFAPGTYAGKAVDTIFQLNVTFRLR
jgi:TonB family protein